MPVVVLPLLSCRHRLLSSRHAAYASRQLHLCVATLHLRLPSHHHLLSAGASPPVYLSFTGWLSCHISSCHRLTLTCSSSTPAFMHTGWLSRCISLRCPRPAGDSPPFCLSFAPTGACVFDLVCLISWFLAVCTCIFQQLEGHVCVDLDSYVIWCDI